MAQLVVLRANGDNWPQSYGCANFLLKEGASILWATRPFVSATDGSGQREHEPGGFLISEVPANGRVDWLTFAEERFELELLRVTSVDRFEGLPLDLPRIGIYGGGGGPFYHARIFEQLGFLTEFVSPQEIRGGRLSEFDILVVPGGGARWCLGQLEPLGADGCREVTEFVKNGGMYMGFCAGAFNAAIVSESFLSECPYQSEMQLANAAVWNRSDMDGVKGLESPGVGIIECRNLRPEHPVMLGLPASFRIVHYNGPFFETRRGIIEGASEASGLAAVDGFTDSFTPSEYFLRISEFDPSVPEQDTLISRAAREGRFNTAVGHNGLGRVVLFGSHPEIGFNLTGDRWGLPARMLGNAAFWQASHLARSRRLTRKVATGTPVSFPYGSGLQGVSLRMRSLLRSVERFREEHKATDPEWLAEGLAMSTFGLSGREIWERGLEAFDDIGAKLDQTIARINGLIEQSSRLMADLEKRGGPEAGGMIESLDLTVRGLEEAIHFRPPEEWQQDYGYEGVLRILERMETAIQKAESNFDGTFEPSPNPYQYMDSSPYQLMVGVYLAALGLLTSAWFLLQVHETRLSEQVFRAQIVADTG